MTQPQDTPQKHKSNERALLTVVLLAMGAGWGICIPLTKLAVSTGYQPFGLIFWQVTIVAVFLGAINALRGKGLPCGPAQCRVYGVVALLGAVLPDIAYYTAAVHLQGGVLSILMSSVPMFAFPIALMLGNDQFVPLRLVGLFLGLLGIVLLIGPEASLPEATSALFIPVLLLAPLCYATEVNYVARWGTAGLDPIQVITGASLLGVVISLPVAVLSGQWVSPLPPYTVADVSLVANSLIHALVYATYVWLTRRAGSVFASQTAYLVTGFGMMWSILLLSESYSGYIWLALAAMLAGIFLVQPRPGIALAPAPGMGETGSGNQKGNPK